MPTGRSSVWCITTSVDVGEASNCFFDFVGIEVDDIRNAELWLSEYFAVRTEKEQRWGPKSLIAVRKLDRRGSCSVKICHRNSGPDINRCKPHLLFE